MPEQRVTLADGRELEVVVLGPDDGDVIVFHHGTPGAAVEPPMLTAAAAAHGLRTVHYSRPGYGTSTAQPGRTVADAAADVAAVLDALGVGTFLTAGWSGGGPHALACAALLPDRCRAASTIAGVAPHDLLGRESWLAGMGASNVAEFTAARQGIDALETFLAAFDRRQITREQVLADIGSLFSAVDVAAFDGDMADYLVGGMRHGLAHGKDGWRDDDLAFVTPWGFDLDVSVPLALWHGREDRMVPFHHGEWLAAALPGARRHLFDDQGHVSLMAGCAAVVDDLCELAGR